MTNISKGKRSSAKLKQHSMGGSHDEFLSRITKSLYYSRLPMTDRLSLPVTELAAELFTEVKCGLTLERLDVEEAGRISRNACVSPCSMVLALLYLERLKDCNPEYLYRVAPSELFLVSLMVASKFLNDEGETDEVFNTEWANSGDLTIGQINRLEKEFLSAIDWTIFVDNHDFWERLRKLEKVLAYREAEKRGWFSYTELTCLMENLPIGAVIHALVSVSSICLATYAAGVVTLLGSVLVASQLPGGTWLARGQQNYIHDKPDATSTTNFSDSRSNSNDILDETEAIVEEAKIELFNRCQSLHITSGSCNSTLLPAKIKNATVEYVGWEWWLDSIITWLPEYSKISGSPDNRNIRNVESLGNDGKLRTTGAFITNSELLFVGERYTRESENLIMEINWKETLLASNLDIPSHDWRYYLSKIQSLDQRH